MFKINLVTRDGATIAYDAEPTETLLDAAARQNIFLPAACREGGCGTCRATRKSGAVTLGPCSKSALSDEDRAAGDILLCRAEARSDLELRAPFDRNAIGFAPIPERRARIAELGPAGARAVRLVLRLEDDPVLGRAADFIPGQFMELAVPGSSARRAYSLANAPNWDGALEFLIRLQPNGVFSTYLEERAAVGDTIVMRGPQGSFQLDAATFVPSWFVAGGTGLAPILSMLRHMAEFGDARERRLFFGVNSEEELFALDAIDDLKRALSNLSVTICVWRPGQSWSGFAGTPADALALTLAARAQQPDLYVCGPPPLVAAVCAAGEKAGIDRARMFSETFLPT